LDKDALNDNPMP